ncbi:Rho termination factor N-terminal domain-containing protein, partial [Hymenobacter sp. 15J16-1T3B]|uniref:Rho termination factor N-terminal domain-containing protein n=1 Tax=Hymenobacter sp. 15J16-1T3B TaxID=2886941 RepID=UPI001D1054F8
MYTIDELKDRLLSELKEIAESLNVGNFRRLSKQDLIYKILDQQAVTPLDKLPAKLATDGEPAPAPAAAAPPAAPARRGRNGVQSAVKASAAAVAAPEAPAAEPVAAPAEAAPAEAAAPAPA